MKLSYLTIGIIILLGFTSCSNSEDPTPEPTKANIIGHVNLFDEGVTEIDNSNMTVTIEGITPTISAVTDTEGKFTLPDVPFGTYSLIYEKSGFGTFKKFNVEHTDTGSSTVITETPSLGQTSTTVITNISASENNNTITIATTMSPEANVGNTRYLRYFFSTQSSVSNENYDAVLETVPAQISPYNLNLNSSSLDALGFTSGQTIYVKCYGESFWSNQYDDPNLGITVFPNLNQTSADAVSFIAP